MAQQPKQKIFEVKGGMGFVYFEFLAHTAYNLVNNKIVVTNAVATVTMVVND